MFVYNAICVMSDQLTTKAGTITSGEDRFMEWKTKDGSYENTQYAQFDTFFEGMFEKERLLDIIKNFICFSNEGLKSFKILAGYHQYFAVRKAVESTKKGTETDGKGGVFWHTQGSGKSLTMIWLSKWLLANIPTARVLVVTDRDELDEQIEKNFKGVSETIIRTKSGADLMARLNSHEDRLLCSLIHKFGKRGGEATEKDYDKYIEELKASLPANFSAKDDISHLQGYHKEKPPEMDGFNYFRYSLRPEGGSLGYSSSSKLSNGPLRPERWSLVYSTFSSTPLSISFLACAEGSAE